MVTTTHYQVAQGERRGRRPVGQRCCCICGVTEPDFPVITTRAATIRRGRLLPLDPTPAGDWADVCTACLHDAQRGPAERARGRGRGA
jgi:hypothetical protein